ncbi:hypothetical protein ANN_27077 [Periplaneta americana]|uniref:Uncharacterized protein n=1 Tax=Periplaneta americana TaxID=6978 RepID=A0ABQ8RX49_PERAM|nr:hypothetical protein ANN_27077 [Periplaneta americana]
MGESRNAYRLLVGRSEGKRPLGRPRRRWEDNIKMDLREVGYDDRDWINLAQDRDQWRAYVRAAMNLRVPLKPVDPPPSYDEVVDKAPRYSSLFQVTESGELIAISGHNASNSDEDWLAKIKDSSEYVASSNESDDNETPPKRRKTKKTCQTLGSKSKPVKPFISTVTLSINKDAQIWNRKG